MLSLSSIYLKFSRQIVNLEEMLDDTDIPKMVSYVHPQR